MDKLKTLIEKYLAADTIRKSAAAKGQITKLVSENSIQTSPAAARAEALLIAQQYEIDWLIWRLTFGSLYKEGDRVMGWWDESHCQAQELPLVRNGGQWSVSFYRRSQEKAMWESRGFFEAQPFPVVRREGRNEQFWEVRFDVKTSLFWLEYGYALPCELQYRWDFEGLTVTRSIISQGFWQAWKWWDGALYWYLEKRPELFADMDWWGEEGEAPRFEPPEDSFAVVLGVQGREVWEARKVSGSIRDRQD